MRYEGTVYRPPSEAYSLIIQVTIGCSHNKCTFCSMYKDKKFRKRNINEIIEDLNGARKHYTNVKKIFLADGNALALKTEYLKEVLLKIKELFPECERVGIYAAPKDILRKPMDELMELNRLGLGIAYLGVESGSDEILRTIKKGVDSKEMIEAGKKVMGSGIKLSITLISGLGGKERLMEHALESARVINEIDPHYLGLLTLLLDSKAEMYGEVEAGKLRLLSPREVMEETRELIKNLKLRDCVFRSNHASNYLALAGNL
ncbi:MAG: B12-binding domain-containing radical SAM protein, partial [Clostridia bacterium]|nr:B12-binding domain-containing radical SAM protein [Clostridia bacterium]